MASPTFSSFPNVNALWCGVCAEVLARLGLRHVVISPGSRSTPLVVAFAGHSEIEAIPVLDERSAAFFALGLAKRTLTPVALVCTSGTAGANYFPAVIEARESGIPLLVITADRPPELRACASGQTIDQQKLFGDYVNFYHELALPVASEPLLRYLRQTLSHAYLRTLGPTPGPVHLNAPFRDPLAPEDDGSLAHWPADFDWATFLGRLTPPQPGLLDSVLPRISTDVHGVIVAGAAQPADPAAYAATVGEISRRLGWPVLAEGLSPLRNYASEVPHLVTSYDTILRNPTAAERLRPEMVLALESWPTSKVLRGWLEAAAAPTLLVSERADNRDALHGRTQAVRMSLAVLAAHVPEATDPNGYQRLWRTFEGKSRLALDTRLTALEERFEGKATWLLAQHLPAGTTLSVANSMPVRDVEYFWPPGDRHIRSQFNRGANGIDGTLSTALGAAHGDEGPAVLLTGDLALLHDTNGFLLRPRFRGSLTIVLINNRGGGIFEHLPIARHEPPFEDFFVTPQEADFEALCRAYGANHVAVNDWAHFVSLITRLPASGIQVLELRTDRKRDAAMRREIFATVAASLG